MRLLTCGSFGDGKSTLIDRLLQGSKTFIVTDTPGDGQYLRNMVAGASTADVAVILVDARQGVLPQTRRDTCIVCLLGIRHIVLAVNKMDLVDHSAEAFGRIAAEYREFVRRVGIDDVTVLPICATGGDNIFDRSAKTPWHRGPTLVEHLETVPVEGRGDVVSAPGDAVDVADQFEATLVWMGRAPMLPGRAYVMKAGTRTVTATVAPLKYKLNFATMEHVAATQLELNEIGVVQLELDRAIAFEPNEKSRELGGFILVDSISNETVGAGMIRFALHRSHNVHWQAIDLSKESRAALKRQRPCVLWFTGISATGKSTIANLLEKRLHAMGRHTYLLDGDNVRHGLTKDLGFTEAARVENIRRVAEVARLMADAGLIVLTAFISPFRSEREMARALLPPGEFLEIFIDTPLAVAEGRDPKGLYRKARRGELKNFTGIDSPYEPPESPDIRIDTTSITPEEAAERIVEEMRRRGL